MAELRRTWSKAHHRRRSAGADAMTWRLALVVGMIVALAAPAQALPLPLNVGGTSPFGYPVNFDARDIACGGTNRMVVLYGRTQGTADEYARAVPVTRKAVENASGVLNTEGEIKSNERLGSRLRIDCDSSGQPTVRDVGVVPNSADDAFDFMCRNGFSDPARMYMLVLDGFAGGVSARGTCGDSRQAVVSGNTTIFGQTGPSYTTLLHETLHMMGAVRDDAPGSDGHNHCTDGRDIMCYGPDATNGVCPERVQVDCRENTYFDPTPEPGEWLALHPDANLGLPSNPWTDSTYTGRGPALSSSAQ